MRMSAEDLTKSLKVLGMSQGDLARDIGVRPETVYRWCKGNHPIPGSVAKVIETYLQMQAEKIAGEFNGTERGSAEESAKEEVNPS